MNKKYVPSFFRVKNEHSDVKAELICLLACILKRQYTFKMVKEKDLRMGIYVTRYEILFNNHNFSRVQ